MTWVVFTQEDANMLALREIEKAEAKFLAAETERELSKKRALYQDSRGLLDDIEVGFPDTEIATSIAAGAPVKGLSKDIIDRRIETIDIESCIDHPKPLCIQQFLVKLSKTYNGPMKAKLQQAVAMAQGPVSGEENFTNADGGNGADDNFERAMWWAIRSGNTSRALQLNDWIVEEHKRRAEASERSAIDKDAEVWRLLIPWLIGCRQDGPAACASQARTLADKVPAITGALGTVMVTQVYRFDGDMNRAAEYANFLSSDDPELALGVITTAVWGFGGGNISHGALTRDRLRRTNALRAELVKAIFTQSVADKNKKLDTKMLSWVFYFDALQNNSFEEHARILRDNQDRITGNIADICKFVWAVGGEMTLARFKSSIEAQGIVFNKEAPPYAGECKDAESRFLYAEYLAMAGNELLEQNADGGGELLNDGLKMLVRDGYSERAVRELLVTIDNSMARGKWNPEFLQHVRDLAYTSGKLNTELLYHARLPVSVRPVVAEAQYWGLFLRKIRFSQFSEAEEFLGKAPHVREMLLAQNQGKWLPNDSDLTELQYWDLWRYALSTGDHDLAVAILTNVWFFPRDEAFSHQWARELRTGEVTTTIFGSLENLHY